MADALFDTSRDHLDRDYTPDAVAAAFCRWLDIPAGARVLEPSVGGGAWARGLRATPAWPIVGADIDPAARNFGHCTRRPERRGCVRWANTSGLAVSTASQSFSSDSGNRRDRRSRCRPVAMR